MAASMNDQIRPRFLVPLFFFLLSLIAVSAQEQKLGVSYIETVQLQRHVDVLRDVAPNPWNYRLLSEWAVGPHLTISTRLHLPHSIAIAFLVFRVMQNLLILGVAWAYYREFQMSEWHALAGLVILTGCFANATYNSDLSLNTYTDVLIYLIGALLVLRRQYFWIIPLAAGAALNRETGVLVPLLPLCQALAATSEKSAGERRTNQVWVTFVAMMVFIATLVTLHVLLHKDISGWQGKWGNVQGWPTLRMNLTDPRFYYNFGLVCGVLLIVPFARWRNLNQLLRIFSLPLVLLWSIVHLVTVYAREARYFLVPIALVLIPSLLSPADETSRKLES
jgi:hypothetical protein